MPSIPHKQVVFLATLFLVVCGLYLSRHSIRDQVVASYNGSKAPELEASTSREDYIAAATQSTLDAFNSTPIAEYCARDKWNSSIVIHCERIFGGIGQAPKVSIISVFICADPC